MVAVNMTVVALIYLSSYVEAMLAGITISQLLGKKGQLGFIKSLIL
jgi:uncharacterized YccA/Bax inhibitor family protein